MTNEQTSALDFADLMNHGMTNNQLPMATETSSIASLIAGEPVHYRIRVAGALDPHWSHRLGGLSITSTGRFDAPSTTVLEGELRDQGALLGVLNTLYELHLPMLSVESLDPS